jgi:hypothetical protein
VYSSNSDEPSSWTEVRHRRFTDWVEVHQPEWRLLARIPQRYPYVEGDPDTSWSDFFLYQRTDAPTRGRRRALVRKAARFFRVRPSGKG